MGGGCTGNGRNGSRIYTCAHNHAYIHVNLHTRVHERVHVNLYNNVTCIYTRIRESIRVYVSRARVCKMPCACQHEVR
jgi:hypothetical protein